MVKPITNSESFSSVLKPLEIQIHLSAFIHRSFACNRKLMRLDEKMKSLDFSQEMESVVSRFVFFTLLLECLETRRIKEVQRHDAYYNKVIFSAGWKQEYQRNH